MINQLSKIITNSCNYYVETPFFQQLINAKLSDSQFIIYLQQDYVYLKENILLLEKYSLTLTDEKFLNFIQEQILALKQELLMIHQTYLQPNNLTNIQANQATKAYLNYLNKLIKNKNQLLITTALLYCSWSYAEIGKLMINKMQLSNPYYEFIKKYTSDDYQNYNNYFKQEYNQFCRNLNSKEKNEVINVFLKCQMYEQAFFKSILK